MQMGVLTKRGQAALEQERIGVRIFESHNPELTFISTPKDKPSRIDGVLADGSGTIKAVVEVKTRYGLTLEKFRRAFKDEWLLTYEKLVNGAKVAELFHVPLVGFLYLVEDKTLLTIQLADALGAYSVPFRVQKTETTRDINGGLTCRNNAFIPMGSAKVFKGKVADVQEPENYPWGRPSPQG
jgi:hypothetical protein